MNTLLWNILGILIGAFFIYIVVDGIIKKKVNTRLGIIDSKKNKISYIIALILYSLLGLIIWVFVISSLL